MDVPLMYLQHTPCSSLSGALSTECTGIRAACVALCEVYFFGLVSQSNMVWLDHVNPPASTPAVNLKPAQGGRVEEA